MGNPTCQWVRLPDWEEEEAASVAATDASVSTNEKAPAAAAAAAAQESFRGQDNDDEKAGLSHHGQDKEGTEEAESNKATSAAATVGSPIEKMDNVEEMEEDPLATEVVASADELARQMAAAELVQEWVSGQNQHEQEYEVVVRNTFIDVQQVPSCKSMFESVRSDSCATVKA